MDNIDVCLVCGIEIPPGPDFCGPECEAKFDERQKKLAIAIFKNIADGFDERGHFLQAFARVMKQATSTASSKNLECLLPSAHKLIETYDLEKQQRERGILHEAQYT